MTVRTDVTIDWELSPRVMTVAAPSVTISVQDIHDTAAAFQDSWAGQQHPNLIRSEGKGSLGSGKLISTTSTLLNTVVEFEARTTPIDTASITTPDTNGKVLIDSASTFITDLVERGDLIQNVTDGSFASVLTVDSEIQLTTTVLGGGTDDQYDSSDVINVYQVVACTIDGGNLLAEDDVDAEMVPILPTFGTHITRVLSTDATLLNAQETYDQAKISAMNTQP